MQPSEVGEVEGGRNEGNIDVAAQQAGLGLPNQVGLLSTTLHGLRKLFCKVYVLLPPSFFVNIPCFW